MSYKAVIFDLDGTLLDSLEDLADAMNRTLEARGLPTHPVDAYRTFVGDGARTLVERALPEDQRDAATVDAVLEAYRKDYAQAWDVKTRPYDGIKALLDRLQANRIPMAILSNKPDSVVPLIVSKLLGDWTFSTARGLREDVPKKPAPDGAEAVAAHLHVLPEEIVYLGDTDTDMQTAASAGMFAVGALWGFRSEQELREHGAREVIAHPVDLLGFFDLAEEVAL